MYSIHSNNSCINNTPFSFILLEKGCVHNLFTHAFVVYGYLLQAECQEAGGAEGIHVKIVTEALFFGKTCLTKQLVVLYNKYHK